MNDKELSEEIKEAFFKCDVCGSMDFGGGIIYKGKAYALCRNCSFNDLIKKEGEKDAKV